MTINLLNKCLGFFDLDGLLEHTSPGTKRRIEEYIKGQLGGFVKW